MNEADLEQNDFLSELWRELKDDDLDYEDFYNELKNPAFCTSSPLEVKVRQAKSILKDIEQEFIFCLGNRELVKIELNKTFPEDVLKAVVKVYEEKDWYVSLRTFAKPYTNQRTGKKVYATIFLTVEPLQDGQQIEDEDEENLNSPS